MLRLEGEARRQGSGLTGDQLKGRWLVRHIWGKDGSRPLPTTELLLRRCEATLAVEQEDASDELRLTNSLALGWKSVFQGLASCGNVVPYCFLILRGCGF
jgi:hypothetical protein